MSYYDDYDDDYSSEDEIYYHNYSVDYANQILGGQHAFSSCVPLMRRKHRRHGPRLVRVSTLDEMPIVNRHRTIPGLRSRPKYDDDDEDDDDDSSVPVHLPPRLPSLETTNEELERRAMRRTEPPSEEPSNNVVPSADNNSSSETPHRPLTEDELRQVQQQQEAFQQHLLNMQRHLQEQSQQAESNPQQQPQIVPSSICSTTCCSKKRPKVAFHDLERDDDQAEIAELIEKDPYFAAAMEDFAHSHGLLRSNRHRTNSEHSSSHYSQRSHKRRQPNLHGKRSRPSHSSSSSSLSSVTNISSDLRGPNQDLILLNELKQIRLLMQRFVESGGNSNQQTPTGIRYPPVPGVTDYELATVPRGQPQPRPEARQAEYQNVVNAVKDVLDRRRSSQRDLPLKPSEIDPKLKHVYTRRPQIPSTNFQPTSMQRPPLPPSQLQQRQIRRRSSQMTSSPSVSIRSTPPPPPPPSSNKIPPAPPYEALTNFSASRSTINQNRTLSYGKHEKQSHIYDTLLPGHYLRLYTNKYN
ncbi:unnamed protein product [Adineta steineri]|uniref:Uncharacterized protein n=1 Tax=Adineta steineri TaxID=433720 RepID=A0A819GRG4_9BILA|nr:unnamed protein product [Adineta steineri]CAF3886772.1 unnamed protein product [Adineta steineri]